MNEYDSNRIYDVAATIGFNKTKVRNEVIELCSKFPIYNHLNKS